MKIARWISLVGLVALLMSLIGCTGNNVVDPNQKIGSNTAARKDKRGDL